MSQTTDTLKAEALAEIAKIKNAAVAEYLVLKTGHYSLTVVGIAAAVALVIGLVLGHKL